MPLIRTRADIDDLLNGPTPAEEKLLAACLAAKTCHLSDKIPAKGTPNPQIHIRADVLRYLITGGCETHPVADWGVDLYGAHVTGALDLDLATAQGVTGLVRCRFDEPIAALQAKLQLLNLDGSAFPELNAQGAKVKGDIFLRKVTAEATVDVNDATIGGQLSCIGAIFNATSGYALNAQGAQVTGGFFFRGVRTGQGVINLTAAQVGILVDDPHSWPPKDRLILDGFTYKQIENAEFPRLSDRLDWLAKGSTWGHEFLPQPYTQLAKVYREMGQDGDARDILAERERRLLRHRFFSEVTLHNGTPKDGVTLRQINFHVILWSFLARIVVGYGYHPFRSVMILFALIALSAVFADRAWQTGGITPNSAHVLVSPGWLAHHAVEGAPAHVWIGDVIPAGWSPDPETPEQKWPDVAPGRDWETFNALAYGADIAIPIIAFGQTDAWAPSVSRGAWGTFLWWWRWVATTTGWIVTGLAAAAVTGIIRRD
ncbi:hypothetical protein [Roseobacter sp.]|uniref:hypothetical protein n=1 Tax=Roseobacter sp. TaxID=1907202 RepID=UPI0029663E4E|nr:hypothetical protein [Roseobacter sp.]MDW3183745.1 hypothetical protein [Roseobacter sp.]